MTYYLIIAMATHIVWSALLYSALTLFRAPRVWAIGLNKDGSNPFHELEPRTSANLSNQFEWPLFFHAACIVALTVPQANSRMLLWLAGVFIIGRILHSGIQIFTSNIRLRGIVFSVNFLAVILMWAVIVSSVFIGLCGPLGE